jgi:hypothetical protein
VLERPLRSPLPHDSDPIRLGRRRGEQLYAEGERDHGINRDGVGSRRLGCRLLSAPEDRGRGHVLCVTSAAADALQFCAANATAAAAVPFPLRIRASSPWALPGLLLQHVPGSPFQLSADKNGPTRGTEYKRTVQTFQHLSLVNMLS